MSLDTVFERDAAHYHVPRRRWSCRSGHSLYETIEREGHLERPEATEERRRLCRRCNKPILDERVKATHPRCAEVERRRLQKWAAKQRAKSRAPRRPCRTCAREFQPTSRVNLDCPSCRGSRQCPTCGKRHLNDGRHWVNGQNWKWAQTKTSAYKRQVALGRE